MAIEKLAAPRFEEFGSLLVAGLAGSYDASSSFGIPALWQRFAPRIGHIPGQTGRSTYGILYNVNGDRFDYLCGVPVSDFSQLPADLQRLTLTRQNYAVFIHPGHVSALRSTWHLIWDKWVPESGRAVANAARFEKYGEGFNPATGMGDMEIWIPLAA